jgi:CDP-paratose 2-epimerase
VPHCIVTGSGGLIGSEAVRRFASAGFDVVGIDNDMRGYFFGSEASTARTTAALERRYPNFTSSDTDVRDAAAVDRIFESAGSDITLVIHAAAQPSHDWAAREPVTDFAVNALGTLNLLEATRSHCPDATFIFTSTNKVYGDTPNSLPLVELDTRFEVEPSHPFAEHGIDETMSIDQSTHSLFGVSKAAADLLVQEYGRYFGLRTGIFRGGCLTGSDHAAAELHGFLGYLMKCTVIGRPYRIFGYNGKQVRDNIHASDLVNAFVCFHEAPRIGEVYNIGGGRYSNVSLIEAIELCEKLSGQKLAVTYVNDNRVGDHMWYVSDIRKFSSHYPEWRLTADVPQILSEMLDVNGSRWLAEAAIS